MAERLNLCSPFFTGLQVCRLGVEDMVIRICVYALPVIY